MMEIEMFKVENEELSGITIRYDDLYEINDDIQLLEELKEEIKKPQVLSYDGLECINLYTETEDEHFIGHESIRWLYQMKCEETNTVNDIRGCMLKCSTENERSKGVAHISHRGITFLPEIQEMFINKYDEYLQKLRAMRDSVEKEEKQKQEEKEKRKSEWKVIKEYKHIDPCGGEEGTDGYIDADYQNKNGVVVRMVSRDVFDFGCYSYPKRVEGTDDVFSNDAMTEEEKSIHKWLVEFGTFRRIRM